jgi:hypothetical protein
LPLLHHERPDELRNLTCGGIERKMTAIEDVHFGLRRVAMIRFVWGRIRPPEPDALEGPTWSAEENSMKIVSIIARCLMGLIFLVFGLNGFLHFIPNMPMPPMAAQFAGALIASHFFIAVSVVQIASGLLFLINRYVPLALILIGPIIVSILLFHILMNPSGIVPGAIVAICWLIVFYRARANFSGVFQAKVEA